MRAPRGRDGVVSEPVMLQRGGSKDSALALQALFDDPHYEVAGLLASFTQAQDRLTMHGAWREPVEAQAEALGQALNSAFLDRLPEDVDPCGEHGEHRSFVHAGPLFQHPIDVRFGKTVARDGHCCQDLIPGA